ncbi:uncharacterized protein [Drosophila bipectinata]|uniref:uncharacterized protein n=1 Tax=Drosophila bipectinata TaxID=42026 RepID=UPI001C8A402C|nr:uncharacterized protein LOC108119098 [Drosophila bipectinata]
MEPRTGRIVSWHLAGLILLMMMEAACGRAQYASPNGNDYATYQPGEVQSIWSSAPIIVNDNGDFGAQEHQARQPFSGFNEYYDGETFRRPYPNWRREERAEWPTTRAPNHNYYNVPGYFYYQQPQQRQPYLPASSELDSSDSRREEEQVVQIGGSRSLATNNYQNVYPNSGGGNYFEPAQPWRPRGRSRDYEAKYAQHFANYLRKYPQRLQPVYQTGEDFVEK